MDHLYIIQSDKTGAIKVGRTSDIEQRVKSLQTGASYTLKVVLFILNKGPHEKSIHKKLSKFKTKGEWFTYEGLSELPLWLYESLDLELVDNWWKIK